MDSNLYGAFPVKRLFCVVPTVFCSERERPLFQRSIRSRGCLNFSAEKHKLTSAPSRSAPAKRPHVGSVFYLFLVGLVAAAIIVVLFGVAFSLLTLPKDHTVVGAGPVSPGGKGEHRKAYDKLWRPAGDNRRFRRHRPGAGSDIACAGPACVAGAGELECSGRGIRGGWRANAGRERRYPDAYITIRSTRPLASKNPTVHTAIPSGLCRNASSRRAACGARAAKNAEFPHHR
jgi:hypothetical protein